MARRQAKAGSNSACAAMRPNSTTSLSPGRPERAACLSPMPQSLFLRKPLLKVAHRGGRLLGEGSLEYHILLNWLRQGAPGPQPTDAHVVGLTVVAPHFPSPPTPLPQGARGGSGIDRSP